MINLFFIFINLLQLKYIHQIHKKTSCRSPCGSCNGLGADVQCTPCTPGSCSTGEGTDYVFKFDDAISQVYWYAEVYKAK
jgi:hypothetical protein